MMLFLRRLAAAAGCLLALALLAVPASGQSNTDGSVYSRFGLGERSFFSSSQSLGMGGGGTALQSFNYANFANPALWSDQVFTRAVIGMRLDAVQATDAQDSTSRLNSGSLEAVQFSFPILEQKLGAGLGFRPYSRVRYRVQTIGTLEDPSLPAPVPYGLSYEGSGGLQEVVAGGGYRLGEHLSLGASASFIFGVIEDTRRTEFSTIDYLPSTVTTATRFWGFTASAGALATFNRVLRPGDALHVGAALTLPTRLNAERQRTQGESLDRDTLGTAVDGFADLPLSTSLGVTYRPSARFMATLNGLFEPWSGFASDLTFPGFAAQPLPDGTAADRFQDRWRVSGGVEWLPAGNDLLAPFFARIAYRIGGYIDQAYVEPIAGETVRATAATLGLSLPALLPGTRLDLSFEAGTRGSTDPGLVRDFFYGVSASVNVGERWFVKRKLR